MKMLYKWSGIAIWAVGILLFAIAMQKGGVWSAIVFQFITITCVSTAGIFVIYSFLCGSQPGHYVRFIMILLFTFLCALIFLNEESVLIGLAYRLSVFLVAGSMVFVSRKHRNRFMSEYKLSGRVDYFDIYFPSKHTKRS